MSRRPSFAILAAVVMTVLPHGPIPVHAGRQAATAPRPAGALSLADVTNATIAGVYDQPVTLKGGLYEGPPFVAGGASRPTLRLLADLVRFGNLDGAPGDEAAVLLSENSGGSGEMIYVAVVGRRGTGAASLATALVGDRTKIRAFAVSGATIVVDVIEAGPDDPMCCPTQIARKTYRLAGGKLVRVGSQVPADATSRRRGPGRPSSFAR